MLLTDYFGGNLYWCDWKKATVEAFSLRTMSRKIILHDLGDQHPMGLALVPEEGYHFKIFYLKFKCLKLLQSYVRGF